MPPVAGWAELVCQHEELALIPAALADSAWQRSFDQGEPLFHLGDIPTSMLFLLQGEVQLVRMSHDGGEVILQRMRGGFIAEASLNVTTYHCDAVATRAGELLGFPLGPFRHALEIAGFRDFWITLLSEKVRSLRMSCERLALHGTAERVIHYLQSEERDGVVTLSCPKRAWAAELGVSHESLYRTLAALQRAGRITVAANRLTLLPIRSSS